MEANELMIGDWLYNSVVDKYYQIYPMWFHQVIGDIADYELQPIPLTAEILDKNGWECENHRTDICFRGEIAEHVWLIIQQLVGYEHWNIKLSKCEISETFDLFIQSKYVHELQHALRLCGLNELADNFKV